MIKIENVNSIITIDDCYNLLLKNKTLTLAESIWKSNEDCFKFLTQFSNDKIIYGVNTGFGSMAKYKLSDSNEVKMLQLNLINGHCGGAGKPISPLLIRAILLARISSIMRASSGVHPDCIKLLIELFNRDIYPVIYEHGGVGASGDLIQLSHVAYALLGEGEVFYKNSICAASNAFKLENLTPLKIHIREGLALINGTSAMCGVGLINVLHAKNLIRLAIIGSCMCAEIVGAYDDFYSNGLNEVKLHKGQNHVASLMANHLKDSKCVKNRAHILYNAEMKDEWNNDHVQNVYSIRCVPQIIGPIYDCLRSVEKVIIDELNSVSDNPIIDYQNENVYHGGNFHGDYVSFEMDKLKISITKLSVLLERQINMLNNPAINGLLPPFCTKGTFGLNFGVMGVQYTATSTTAENMALSNSMYVHNIPSNNDNQDVVSMGFNSAMLANKVIENTYQVMAIYFLTILKACELLDIESKLSQKSRIFYNSLKCEVPEVLKGPFVNDIVETLKNEIAKVNPQECFVSIKF